MTRTAPLLTLLAAAALGGGLLATNHVVTPLPAAAQAAPAPAVPAPAVPAAVPALAAPAPAPAADPVAARQTGTVPPPAPAEAQEAVPDEIAYAGWTQGRRMTVAIVVNGDDVVAYLCDADDEVWLRGTVTDGTLDLENADGSATLTGSADDDGAEGTVRVDGEYWAFSADATTVEDAEAAGRDDVARVAERAGVDY